jgi:competence protein ComEC
MILGILLGFYLQPKFPYILSLLLITLLVLAITFKKQKRHGFPFFGIIACVTTTLLGILLVIVSKPENNKRHYMNHLENQENIWQVKVDEVLKPSAYSKRYIVKAQRVNQNKVTGKLILRIANDSSDSSLSVDDELTLFCEAKTIPIPLNHAQFNYKEFLEKKRIYHQLTTGKNEFVLNQNSSKTIYGIASRFRSYLIQKLHKESFGKEELSIIQALLLGQRNDISEETYNNYKNAGAVHILAVSGLHIGILLLLLQFLLSPLELLPKGKTIKLIALVFCLWAFAFIAGLSASVVRAVTMFSFVAYAMYLNRPTNTFNIIALSMFFILLIKPLFLFQVGFQMSYAAVIAIVWIYPKLQRFWYPENRIVRKGWQLFAVSLAAQLGVLPISLFYFHQFPALFFVSNLVVIPFLGLILGAGILVVLLIGMNALPETIAIAYNFLIKSMNFVIEFVAQQEAFIFRDISFDRLQLLLGYLILTSLVVALSKPKFKYITFLLLSFVALQAWHLCKLTNVVTKEQLVLTHETANSMLLKQKGRSLYVYGNRTDFSSRIIKDYKIAESIDDISYTETKNVYSINNKKLYVMDSLAVYPSQKRMDYLVLTFSPKVNLERLLDSIPTKKVIVDGSNYTSYVNRWRETCLKRKLPFHYTGEKGAYYFK